MPRGCYILLMAGKPEFHGSSAKRTQGVAPAINFDPSRYDNPSVASRGTLFMVLLSTSASSPAQNTRGASDLATGHRLGARKNPNLLSGQAARDATRASEVTAGLRQNPSLTLGGTDVTLPANTPGNPYSYSANLSRLFERGQKRRLAS